MKAPARGTHHRSSFLYHSLETGLFLSDRGRLAGSTGTTLFLISRSVGTNSLGLGRCSPGKLAAVLRCRREQDTVSNVSETERRATNLEDLLTHRDDRVLGAIPLLLLLVFSSFNLLLRSHGDSALLGLHPLLHELLDDPRVPLCTLPRRREKQLSWVRLGHGEGELHRRGSRRRLLLELEGERGELSDLLEGPL